MSICLEFPAAAKHLQIAEEACGMAITLEEQTKKKKKNGTSGLYLFLHLIWYVMLLFIYFS